MTQELPRTTPEIRRGILKWSLKADGGLFIYGLILFLSAGKVAWLWGWVFIAVLALHLASHPLLLLPTRPDLLAEREKGFLDKPVKSWDKRLTSLAGTLMVCAWVVAGLDERFGWTGGLLLAYHLAGLALVVVGYALFMGAMVTNAFFSEGVRIQTERGHFVVTGGPYRVVRHPGYAGTILAHLGLPLLLGSLWVVLPGLLLVGVVAIRAGLEDKMLQEELAGYKEYAGRTRARLLPGIW